MELKSFDNWASEDINIFFSGNNVGFHIMPSEKNKQKGEIIYVPKADIIILAKLLLDLERKFK